MDPFSYEFEIIGSALLEVSGSIPGRNSLGNDPFINGVIVILILIV